MDVIDIKHLKGGSTALIIGASAAMLSGKLAPCGYDRVVAFFKLNPGKLTAAHHLWLRAEATLADRLDEACAMFPCMDEKADGILNHMHDEHRTLFDSILEEVRAGTWSVSAALQVQSSAVQELRTLLSGMQA